MNQDANQNLAHEKAVVYVAGALNAMSCDYINNVRRMIVWAEKIRKLGFAVFVPGIDFLCGVVTGTWTYGIAFDNSQAFLARADIMFVCPGAKNSKGTQREIKTAKKLHIPIFHEELGFEKLRKAAPGIIASVRGIYERINNE